MQVAQGTVRNGGSDMAYDITIIRPEMKMEAVRPRGRDLDKAKRKALKKGLRALHSLEIMATKIYKCQITSEPSRAQHRPHSGHVQRDDAHAGLSDQALRVRVQADKLAGALLDGRVRVRTGLAHAWEASACSRPAYGWRPRPSITTGSCWTEPNGTTETRVFIEKDRADEYGHIARWKELLEHPGGMVDARSA